VSWTRQVSTPLPAWTGSVVRWLVLLPVWAWLLLLVALPALVLAAIALATPADAIPPFALGLGLDSLLTAVVDPFYRDALLASLRVAALASGLCLLLGYPMALAIARAPPQRRPLLLTLVMLPFWTGFLLRIAAWTQLLRDDGWINAGLLAVGAIAAPLRLLHTDFAMLVGIVYAYLPFMVLPLEARLARADPALEQAAADLGAGPWRRFATITLPLSMPGVVAGLVLVFVPVTGEYVIPEMLGGPRALMIGRVIWQEFFDNHDWPLAASLSLVLLALLLAPALVLRRAR
jgi:putrescine transport system permease protein